MAVKVGVLILCLVGVHGKYNFKDESVLEVIIGSFTDCKESCNSRVACVDVLYDRYHKICILYKTEIPLASERNPCYVKDQYLKIDQQNVTGCDKCTRDNCRKVIDSYSCLITVCPTPVKVTTTVILGNSNVIGAKRMYQCTVNAPRSYEIQCLQNGSWSYQDVECEVNMCTLRHAFPDGDWRMERLNSTHMYVNATCNTGYDMAMPETAVCDIKTGLWSGLELICCDIYTSTLGLKIYNSPAYVPANITRAWRDGEDLYNRRYGEQCAYRNASIIDNWSNFTIDEITLRVIENNTVVAYLKFNGTGSTNMDWFAKDKLLDNSWKDLNKTSDTQYFRITGNQRKTLIQRFLISKNTDPNGNCWNDTVWFAVTLNQYPCGNTSNYRTPRILYAKDDTVSQFVVNEMGFADKFEVWIKPIP